MVCGYPRKAPTHAPTLRGSRLDVGGLVVEGVVPLELRELGDEVVERDFSNTKQL